MPLKLWISKNFSYLQLISFQISVSAFVLSFSPSNWFMKIWWSPHLMIGFIELDDGNIFTGKPSIYIYIVDGQNHGKNPWFPVIFPVIFPLNQSSEGCFASKRLNCRRPCKPIGGASFQCCSPWLGNHCGASVMSKFLPGKWNVTLWWTNITMENHHF